jgi:hypothetical protein
MRVVGQDLGDQRDERADTVLGSQPASVVRPVQVVVATISA